MSRQFVIVDFVATNSWFDVKYRDKLDGRHVTMKMALGQFLQCGGSTIVETGCTRIEEEYGDGNSTVIFSEFAARYGGRLWSVDINEEHITLGRSLTNQWADIRTLVHGDSVAFLHDGLPQEKGFPGRIDMLYLDSFDYPLGDLWERTSLPELHEALEVLRELGDAEVVRSYGDIIAPCQEHCLAELEAALPYLHDQSIVLLDDNDLPGGGKPRLAKLKLAELGWNCLFDSYQTLWLKR